MLLETSAEDTASHPTLLKIKYSSPPKPQNNPWTGTKHHYNVTLTTRTLDAAKLVTASTRSMKLHHISMVTWIYFFMMMYRRAFPSVWSS